MKVLDDFLDACQEVADSCEENKSSILFGLGITAIVGAFVGCSVATTKAVHEIEEAKCNILDTNLELEEAGEEPLTEKEETGELIKAYCKTIKYFALPVIALGAGIAALAKSRTILIEEYEDKVSTLAAAYVGLDNLFRAYRQRVIEDQGEEKDFEYRYGTRKGEREVEYIDEKGRKKKRKETYDILPDQLDPEGTSKFFDEGCNGYVDDPELNKLYIKHIEKILNELILARYNGRPSKVYLNEVYDKFGIERTDRGQLLGWVYDPNDPLHNSVHPIVIGIYDQTRANRRFINGLEPVVLMHFNCETLIGGK